MIQIDKNIPMRRAGRPTGTSMYPFEKMEVGDSFLVPAERAGSAKGCSYIYGRTHNVTFASRKTDGGYRIWRIA